MNPHDHMRRKDYHMEDDVYVNVEELNKEASLNTGLEMNEAQTSKKVSTINTIKTRIILAALIVLIILFLILIIVTSVLITYYLAMSKEMSHLKNHENVFLKNDINDLKNRTGNLTWILEDAKIFKKDLVKLRDAVLAETRQINKTLEHFCTLCPAGWTKDGSSCYFISEEATTWDLARDECYKINSVLVMIKDKTEWDTLKKVFRGSTIYWIGLRRDPNKVDIWKWLDGTLATFFNWAPKEPNNTGGYEHCGETTSGPWNDRLCSDKLHYICQRIRTC